ncbi:MAG: hypothetical protein ACK5B9_13510 [Flavobacteriia bacterium]|jgi:hypothetical protein
MRNISDDELDFILEDIKANGVVLEDLQNSLLDHICCIIEHEMPVNEDFYKFYRQILPRFFKKELKELQVETENLLTFKNYYAMRNTLKISGIVSALFTILGATLKVLHLPGAGFAIILGGTLFSLLFLPLMIVLKFKDEEKQVDKIVLSFGFLIAMVAFTGVIFKLMHWPWANIMMISGTATFVFAYVPLYYFTRVRRPELKFNATINSVLMMACGGLIFALFNLGYGQNKNEKLYENLSKSSTEIIINVKQILDKTEVKDSSILELQTKLEAFQENFQKLEIKK